MYAEDGITFPCFNFLIYGCASSFEIPNVAT
jgi:hypothetical protein